MRQHLLIPGPIYVARTT